MKYLLDTNICIYIINKKPTKVIQKLISLNIDDAAISSITLSELEYGIQKSLRPIQNKLALAEFLVPIEVLDYNDLAAEKYGEIRAELEQKGNIIGAMDLLIVAHAVSERLILVTNNEREFKRIKNLKVENWAK
jgi:tRNA(fMet)-specific endonuclease VapC